MRVPSSSKECTADHFNLKIVLKPEIRAYINPCRKSINHLLTTTLVQMTWASWIVYSFIQQILIDNCVILDIANLMVSKQVSLYLAFFFFYSIAFLVCEQPMKKGPFYQKVESYSPCHTTGSSPCNSCLCVQSLSSIVFCVPICLVQSHYPLQDRGGKNHCSLSMHRHLDSLALATHNLMVLWC